LQVLDDTYNANPASMEAALQALADRPARGRRIAALGDMLELGESARECHRHVGELAGQAGVACLFGMGEYACDTIAAARAVSVPHAEVLETHRAIAEAIHAVAEPEDVLLVKGSRGMQMERVIEALRGLYS
jgi:UDP-N-acetylmuramyl pentapeptide synthase